MVDWIKAKLVQERNIHEEDLDIFRLVDSAEEAVGAVDEFYSKYSLKPNF